VGLPSEPTSVVAGTSGRRAYLLQPLGNAISEIDLARREVNRTLILDESPLRGALSRDGDNLYVITRFSNDLLVIDVAGLTLKGRIHVGSRATCVEVDPKTDLVYVGRKSGSISVVDASSLMPIDQIRAGGHVAFLDIDRDQNSLFALLPDRRTVQKIDLVSRRPVGAVEIADGGFAVVLMDSR
jgi:DNA-binding beta-propeller fold protein YncE